MKAIVHLGMPKTGTTAIQSWLTNNQAQLREQGIGYDRASASSRPSRPAHAELSVVAAERADRLLQNRSLLILFRTSTRESQRKFAQKYEVLFRRKMQALKTDVVVLSSEYLGADLNTRKQIAALDSWLLSCFDEVQYVIYFRRQEDLVLSSYSQRLKSGSNKTFEEFFATVEPHNYASMARRWVNEVGSKRIDIRLFEQDWLVGGDIVADFAHVIGTDTEKMVEADLENPSLGIAAQHVMRAINDVVPHTLDNGSRFNPLKSKLRRHIMSHPNGGARRTLTEEQTNHIRTINEEGNAKLRVNFFRKRKVLFPVRNNSAEDASPDPSHDVAVISADIIAHFARGPNHNNSTVAPAVTRKFSTLLRSVARKLRL